MWIVAAADERMRATDFRGTTCSAPRARSRWMRDLVVKHLPSPRPLRILDLGCGTGSLVVELSAAVEGAAITGIDVSSANIAAARAAIAPTASTNHIAFEEADYLSYDAPPFDVIVTDGVVHLIAGSTETLLAKFARDLRPAGILVCAMPYDCTYNRVFGLVRRALRRLRSPATDALILAIGRAIHGREMDDRALRERIPYMYMPPLRLDTAFLSGKAAPSVGLNVIARYPVRSVSLSQLRHRVTVFQKETR
jgi:SAM-dependent methyltransferase